MKYFQIKQKNGRKSVYRVYKTDSHRCEYVQGFADETAAKAKVRQLTEEEKRL